MGFEAIIIRSDRTAARGGQPSETGAGGVPPLTIEEAEAYRVQAPEWALRDEATRIERTYRFRSFGDAFAFVRGAGTISR